jgi:hypothetical protein
VLLCIVQLAKLDRVLVQFGVGLEDAPHALSAGWKEEENEEGDEEEGQERGMSRMKGTRFSP